MRIFLGSLFILVSCTALAQNSKENADFKLAVNLFNDGLYELAADQLKQFIGTYPTTPQGTEARFYLGLSQMKLGQVDDARGTFQTFALTYQDNPKAPEAWKNVGEIYASQMNHREAALAFERVKVFHPRSPLAPEALVLAGRQFGLAGMPDDARRVLRIVLQEYPASGAVHTARTALAELYFREGQTALAQTELLRVVEGDPSPDARAQALLILGDIYRAQWRLDDAKARYQEVITKHPESSAINPARVHLGILLNETGKHSEAMELFKKTLADKSVADSGLIYSAELGLGAAYEGSGDYDRAVRQFERLFGRGNDLDVLVHIASAANKAGNFGKVADTGNRILNANPPDKVKRQTLALLAESAMSGRNYGEAIRIYSRFLEEYPRDPASPMVLLRSAAVAREPMRDPRRGALYCEAVISRFPRSPQAVDAHLLAAECYEQIGDFDRAVELRRMLVESYPSADAVVEAKARIRELVTFEAKDKDSAVDQLALLLGDVATGEQKQDIAFRLGKTYFENLKNYAAAADQFTRVINSGATGSQFEEALLYRAKSYEYLSWRDPSYTKKAVESYNTFLESYGSHPAADEAVQSLFELQSGTLAEAQQSYAMLIASHPATSGKPAMMLRIGILQQEAGSSDDALATFSSILSESRPAPSAEEASFRRFELLLVKGESDSAIAEGERYVARYPEGAHAAAVLHSLGDAALASGDAPRATRFLLTLVNRFEYTSHGVDGKKSLARAYASDERYNEAIELYTGLVEETRNNPFDDKPPDGALLLGAAGAYRKAGRSAEARRMLYDLLEEGQMRGEAFAALGMLAKDERDIDLATAYFRQSAIADPDAASTRDVADMLFESGAYADAIDKYKTLAGSAPSEADARYFETQAIIAQLRSGQLQTAQKEIGEFAKKFTNHDNELGSFELEKGNHYFRKSDYKTARASYDVVLKKYDETPSAPDALYWTGKAFEVEGNPKEALKRFEALLKEYPDSPIALRGHFAMGNLSYNAEQWDDAIRHYRIVVESPATGDDLLPFAMSNLIETYEAAGVFDAALDLARRYLDRYPSNEDSFDKKIKIGILYQRLGYNDQSIVHLQGLLDQAGSDLEGEIRYYIAEANFNKGDFQQAILDFLKVPYLVTKKGKIDWTANSLYMAGQSYERIGKYDQAVAMYKQILERSGIDETFKAAAKKEIDRVNLVLKGTK